MRRRTISALATLELLRMPDGAFWQQFRHVIAPVCLERQGSFVERRGSLQQVELPRGMLPLVNQLQVLARTLWDKEGKRRPLVYQIYARGLPLPPPASHSTSQRDMRCSAGSSRRRRPMMKSSSWTTWCISVGCCR